jgi:hypothetical protein
LVVPVSAKQDEPSSRADALYQERARKFQQLQPNRPDGLQRALGFIESRLVPRDGVYPRFRTITSGSGLTLGAGYRSRALFGQRGTLDVSAAGSMRKYWTVEGHASFPSLAGGRMTASVDALLREYPGEDFFGLGPESLRADASSYSLRFARLSGQTGARLAPRLTVGGAAAVFAPRTGRGREGGVPSVEQLFDATQMPGFGARVNFLETSAFAELDLRRPLNARQGGYYRADVTRFDDPDHRFSFTRTQLDLRQYIGFLDGRRILALRGLLTTTDAADGSEVPFYLMPTLGGSRSLRGYRSYRFRGPHALLLQAEYRWELWSALDAAIFYDAGKVAMRRRDLNFQRLQDDYGFGFRFNTNNGVVLRIDSAFGSRDGKRLHLTMSGAF